MVEITYVAGSCKYAELVAGKASAPPISQCEEHFPGIFTAAEQQNMQAVLACAYSSKAAVISCSAWALSSPRQELHAKTLPTGSNSSSLMAHMHMPAWHCIQDITDVDHLPALQT